MKFEISQAEAEALKRDICVAAIEGLMASTVEFLHRLEDAFDLEKTTYLRDPEDT